ncbi:MAG: DUF4340 domain-containing protein [Myxococcaceae bacterium]|nr:DUF4340 domain-containing protein [Myxococcaceae bacterium]
MSQAKKTVVTLLLLMGVTAGLGWFAYSGVYKKDEAEAEKKDHDNRLFAAEQLGEKTSDGGVPSSEFVKIAVTAKGETTVLERQPGHDWRITTPLDAAVDKVAVDALVSQLQTSKFKNVVHEFPSETELTEYGLNPPTFLVTATALVGDSKSSRTVKLEGGIENTYNGTVFMRRDGEKTVFAAEGGARWALEKTTFDLRQKELFSYEEPKLNSIEVKTQNNQYRLERAADKSWQIVKPFAFPADPAALGSMLGGLKAERAIAFLEDTPEARKQWGLSPPRVDAVFGLEGTQKVHVLLGSPGTDAGAKTYLLKEGDGASVLAEVGAGALAHLDRNPLDLRDKTVLTFKNEDVARISMRLASGVELVAEKTTADGGSSVWQVTAPQTGAARTVKITSVMWALSALKASTLGTENPKDWGKYGIEAKSRTASVSDAQGKVLATLTLGKPVPGQANLLYARGSRNQVVEIDTSRLSELPTQVEDLLDVPPPLDAGLPRASDAGI